MRERALAKILDSVDDDDDGLYEKLKAQAHLNF